MSYFFIIAHLAQKVNCLSTFQVFPRFFAKVIEEFVTIFELGDTWHFEGFNKMKNVLNCFFNASFFAIFEFELERSNLSVSIGGNIIDATARDAVILKSATTFDKNLVEIELDAVFESVVVISPFALWATSLKVGDDDGFIGFINLDAINFTGQECVAKHDVFVGEIILGFGRGFA